MRDEDATNDHAHIPVYKAKKGQKFRLPPEYGDNRIFTFDHMDGMYSFARDETGNVLNWAGPVVLVNDES